VLVAILAGTIVGLRVLLNLPVRGWNRICGAEEEEMPQPHLVGAQVFIKSLVMVMGKKNLALLRV